MSSSYVAVHFNMADHDADIWMALLGELPFESFHEEEHAITGYIPNHAWRDDVKTFIDANAGIYFQSYTVEHVTDQNWNAVWESSFQPVVVDQYCYIRAAFHNPAPAGFVHEVIIAPKMAFGTGHHATTWMMIRQMAEIDFKNKRVLDFGCGTGILAVVAAKEGADEIIGIDIQPEAIENSIEHAKMNGVESVCTFIEGGFEAAGTLPYDIILANINTKIIIEYFDELKALLRPKGFILLSGIMISDMPLIEDKLNISGLQKIADNRRDDWVQLTFTKNWKI